LSVSDDVFGYNAYNPKSGNTHMGPKPDPHNFDDVFPSTTPGSSSQRAAYAAASNCFKTGGGEVPEYYICRGNGDYEGHEEEIFCQTDIAQHCLDDLRENRSRSVSSNCSYTVDKVRCNATAEFGSDDSAESGGNRTGHCWVESTTKSGMQLLGVVRNRDKWSACCPVLSGSAAEFYASSAYPDALLCLKQAACDTEKVYTDLVAECEERCCADGKCHSATSTGSELLPAYADYTYTEGGPCAPSTPSAAFGLRPVALPGIALTSLLALSLLSY